jgi:hypothetical protein
MADRKPTRQSSRGERASDPRAVRRFLEELFWVLGSNSHLEFRSILDRFEVVPLRSGNGEHLARHVSKNPNIHFLIGTLPIIFSDEKFFPSNEDIAEFASDALSLPISRWEKRSRYELIGRIVCETANLDDERLARLVDLLSRMVSNDPNAHNLIRDRKLNHLSWNEIIQRISRDENS